MRRRPRQHGMTILFAGVFLLALMGLTSLAVDWGRVQTARNELQDAADAAARYAVTGLRDNSYLAKAQASSVQNKVDGSYVTLLSSDVEVGTWNSAARTFTVGGTNRNAVRVWGRRIATRNNAVPLYFARAVGRPSYDLIVNSIACQDVTPYSVVALNGITMSGTTTIQRKSSETSSGSMVVASNGSWSLGSSALVSGDALYRTTTPTGNITGTKTSMGSNISYSNVTAPPGAMYVGAVSYSSGSYSVGGDYSCTACTASGSFTISLTADTNMYCSGNVSFGGNSQVITNGYKFTIYMTGASGTIAMTNNLPVSVVIYGPNATMTVNATGKITGSFVCKSLSMSGGTIEYTSTMPIPIAPTGGGAATTTTGVTTVAVPTTLN